MATPIDVAKATANDFRPLLGATFQMTLPSGQKTPAKLASVDEERPFRADMRVPFTLVFDVERAASSGPVQGNVVLAHEAFGTLELFAVALQPQGDVAPWAIVFG